MTNHGLQGQSRRWMLVFAVKITIGIAIIFVLLARIDLTDGWRTILGADPGLCLGAFALFGLSRLAEGIRQYYLVPGRELPVRRSIEIVFVSTFFNNFTAFVVGDGYRVAALWKRLNNLRTAVAVVVIDRLLGVAAIFGLGLLYIPLFRDRLRYLAADVTFYGPSDRAATVVLGGAAVVAILTSLALWKKHDFVLQKIKEVLTLISTISTRNWLAASFWSIVAQLAAAAMIFSLVIAFGGILIFADTLFIMLFVFIASYIPVSVGSLGIREGAVVLGLVTFGLTKSDALAVALISRMMIYQYALAAGLFLFFHRGEKTEMKRPTLDR